MIDSDKFELDNRKLNNMLLRIIGIERINLRTKEFNENDIKARIRQIIEEEVQCN